MISIGAGQHLPLSQKKEDKTMISTILSGLALLAVTVNLILTIVEKKRDKKRRAAFETWKQAFSDYIDAEKYNITEQSMKADAVLRDRLDFQKSELLDFKRILGKQDKDISDCFKKLDAILEDMESMKKRLVDLEHGVVPDFEEALAAKNAVDEFSRGLSSILNYDPVEAYRKKQQQEKYGAVDD